MWQGEALERGWERGQMLWDHSVLAMKFNGMRQESLWVTVGDSPLRGLTQAAQLGSELLGKRASQRPHTLRTLLQHHQAGITSADCTLNKEAAATLISSS